MALKFRRGTTAQKSGSLAFGEPYVNTTLGTLQIGLDTGDVTLSATGTGSNLVVGGISGSSLNITGNAKIDGNLSLGGQLTIGDNTSDTVNVVASLSSSLIPSETNAFDLGSSTKIWRDLYLSTASIILVDGSGGIVNTITNANIVTTDSISSGAIDLTESLPSGTVSSSAQVVGILSELNTYTGSLKSALSVSGSNLTVLGNLTVQGDTTTINTANLLVEDHIVEIAIGANTSLEANGAGLRIPGPDAIIRWSHTGSAWSSNKSFDVVGDITVSGTVDGVDVASLNSNINSFSSSALTRLSALEAETSNLESFTSSINTTIKSKMDTDGVISGSSQLTSSYDSRYVTLDGSQTINGTKTFNDIVVNGTGSFAYITSVSGDAKIIGDSFIVLNTDTPTSRYAGMSVYDSGSTASTASFYYDGETNDWGYEYSSSTGVDYAVTIFGPEYATKGNPTYLTTNKLPKSVDNHHLNDSNITDTGTLITLGSNTVVNGTFFATGTSLVSGSSQVSYVGLSNIPAGIISGSSQVTLSSTTGYGTVINQNLLTTSDVRHNSLGIGMAASATAGRIDASGDIVAYSTSDRNFKENITPIPNALEKISKISGNTYDWKEDMKDFHGFEGNDVGVIAQEIEEVLPQLVTTRETGYKAVKYDKLVALLIEGIKEQQTQIHNLTLEIEKLKESKGL